MDRKLLQKTHLIGSSDHINEILQPLSSSLNIDVFGYVRIYPDNTHLSLCNLPGWIELLYTELFEHGICQKSFDTYTSDHYGLWNDAKDLTTLKAMIENCNVNNGITIIQKNELYCNLYNFASSDNNSSTSSFYMNCIDIFNSFSMYFDQQAASLIKEAEQDRNVLPKCTNAQFPFKGIVSLTLKQNLQKTLNQQYPSSIGLTGREIEVATYMAHGLSYQETADQMCISKKTVETHLTNAKRKLACKNTIELVSKLISSHNLALP